MIWNRLHIVCGMGEVGCWNNKSCHLGIIRKYSSVGLGGVGALFLMSIRWKSGSPPRNRIPTLNELMLYLYMSQNDNKVSAQNWISCFRHNRKIYLKCSFDELQKIQNETCHFYLDVVFLVTTYTRFFECNLTEVKGISDPRGLSIIP